MAFDYKGIDTIELEKIYNDLQADANEVLQILKKIDAAFNETEKHLNDDITLPYKVKYQNLAQNYNMIYNNLISMSEEFSRIIFRYKENDEILSESVIKSSNNQT